MLSWAINFSSYWLHYKLFRTFSFTKEKIIQANQVDLLFLWSLTKAQGEPKRRTCLKIQLFSPKKLNNCPRKPLCFSTSPLNHAGSAAWLHKLLCACDLWCCGQVVQVCTTRAGLVDQRQRGLNAQKHKYWASKATMRIRENRIGLILTIHVLTLTQDKTQELNKRQCPIH